MSDETLAVPPSCLSGECHPADPNLLYLGVGGGRGAPADFRFFRSRDGGATWQQLEEHHFSLCSWNVPILQPHPADARRVFRVADCIAGRTFGETLTQSTNGGASWTPLFNPQPNAPPFLGYPQFLVGGQGLEPAAVVPRGQSRSARRWLVALPQRRRRGHLERGARLPRRRVARLCAGRGPERAECAPGRAGVRTAQPDHVYIGRQVFPGFFEPPAGGAVAASPDEGETWADLGRQDIGAVSDLAVGTDGGWLFAATDQGLWRWRLGAGGK